MNFNRHGSNVAALDLDTENTENTERRILTQGHGVTEVEENARRVFSVPL